MSGDVETRVRSAIPVWARLAAGVATAAGLAAAASYRPGWPSWLWAATKPTQAEQIHRTLLLAGWAALVALLAAFAWVTVLRPPLVEETTESPLPPWIRRPREKPAPDGYSRPPAELVAIFKTPPRRPAEHVVNAGPALPGELPPVRDVRAAAEQPPRTEATRKRPVVRACGRFAVEPAAAVPVTGRAARGLILYLLLKGGPVSAQELQQALWPNEPPAATRKRLWKAKEEARLLLGDALVHHRGGTYELDRDRIRTDTDELEQALQDGAGDVSRALALTAGEPLENVDFPWAETERRRLNALRVEYLQQTAAALLASGDHIGAITVAERLITIDGLNLQGWLIGMQAEGALGYRGAVITRYQQLRRQLDTLGLQPGADITDTYQRLLGQQ